MKVSECVKNAYSWDDYMSQKRDYGREHGWLGGAGLEDK